MCSGILLAGFVCMHMLFLSTVLFGAGSINALSHALEVVYAEQIGGRLVALLLVLHMLTAAQHIPFKAAQSIVMWRHARRLHHADTWWWVAQVVTAFFLTLIVPLHLWEGLLHIPIQAASSALRIQESAWGTLYLFFIPILFIHLIVGVWRVGLKWGFVSTAQRAQWNRPKWYFFSGIVLLAYVTLIRFWTLNV